MLAVGTSLTTSPFNPNMPAGKNVIHATNNAEDINKDYPAALGILGDAKLVLSGLVDALKAEGSGSAPEIASARSRCTLALR